MRDKVLLLKKHKDAVVPSKAHNDDAGYDLYSVEDVVLEPMQQKVVGTGICISMPPPVHEVNIFKPYQLIWEAQVRPRSGMAAKHGITVLNAPGTIDTGFTNEIGVILINLGNKPYKISLGDKIAQLVFDLVVEPVFDVVDKLPPSDRGGDGFGSSGK